MKNKILVFATALACISSCTVVNVSATNYIDDDNETMTVSVDSVPTIELEDGSELISETTSIDDGIITITVESRRADGTLVTDTLSYSAVATLSSSGSDTVTRKKEIKNWGTFTITATFSWWESGAFAYVKCNSAQFTYSLASDNIVYAPSQSSATYTSEAVSVGKAYAKWDFYVYNSNMPFNYQDGTLKITCTDTGTISDSGF